MFQRVTTDAVSIMVMMAGTLGFAVAVIVTRLGRTAAASEGGKQHSGSWIGVGLQFASFIVAGLGPMAIIAYRETDLPRALAVAALMVGAVLLFAAAARAMGANWAIVARTRADHQLVTAGPFAWVRNPIYLAMAMMLIAVAVATNRASGLIVAAPLFAIGTWIRIRAEERLLGDMFGDDYCAYAKRVKRIIPGLL